MIEVNRVTVRTPEGRALLHEVSLTIEPGRTAIIGAGNVPGTGGNTGTAEGFLGDLNGGAIRSRQIELEFLWRY